MHRWSLHFASSVVSIGIVLLFLSSCVTQQSRTTITSDGQGTNEIIVGIAKEVQQQIGANILADAKKQSSEFPAEWNTQVEPWEDDAYVGMNVSMQFTNLDMLETQLNTVLGPDAPMSSESSSGGGFERFEVRQEGTNVIISTQMIQKAPSDTTLPPEALSTFKLSWGVEMPSIETFTEEHIATREGNRVTWTFPVGQEATYNLEVRGSLGEGAPTDTSPNLSDERCFAEVPYCISGRIRQFWEQNGGLPVFGLPITAQQAEVIEGQSFQAQWFERNRLELHPENSAPYDVLLGRLGVDVLAKQGRDWQTFPTSPAQPDCLSFETGHSICGDFLQAWRANGLEIDGVAGFSQEENTALFGLPVSDPMTELLSDGVEHTVQYFERARFESHPQNDPPYTVLFGLLGNEMRQQTSN